MEMINAGNNVKPAPEYVEDDRQADVLMNPVTGEEYPSDDADQLITAYEDADFLVSKLRAFTDELRRRLGAMTEGTAQTRRVRGERRQCKVEMPGDTWSQPALKQLVELDEDMANVYLRISGYAVNINAYKKLLTMTGPAKFTNFKAMLLSANQGPKGLPRIILEKDVT